MNNDYRIANWKQFCDNMRQVKMKSQAPPKSFYGISIPNNHMAISISNDNQTLQD